MPGDEPSLARMANTARGCRPPMRRVVIFLAGRQAIGLQPVIPYRDAAGRKAGARISMAGCNRRRGVVARRRRATCRHKDRPLIGTRANPASPQTHPRGSSDARHRRGLQMAADRRTAAGAWLRPMYRYMGHIIALAVADQSTCRDFLRVLHLEEKHMYCSNRVSSGEGRIGDYRH